MIETKYFTIFYFLGGKPVTVQMAGGGQKTLTLVQAPQNIQTTRVQQTASLTDVTDEMIQMPSGPGGDSPAQNAESIKIEEHNPPQVNLKKYPQKQRKKQPKDCKMQ